MYLKYLQFLSLISLTICHHVTSLNHSYYKDSRIVGGTNEEIENAPWQISLQLNGKHKCGGSIYSETIIITAAHCVYGERKEELQIRAGSSKHAEGGTLIKVARIKTHERYNRLLLSNDVAVLRLAEPLTFGTRVKAIPLAKTRPRSNQWATATGWGTTGFWQGIPSQLQSTKLQTMSRTRCKFRFFPVPTCTVICAEGRRSGVCSGDSGGPLVLNNELVGIASFTRFFCRGPGAFVNVAKMHDWISSAIKEISADNSGQ